MDGDPISIPMMKFDDWLMIAGPAGYGMHRPWLPLEVHIMRQAWDASHENTKETVRDSFAKAALVHPATRDRVDPDLAAPERVAEWAYSIADALIVERAKKDDADG